MWNEKTKSLVESGELVVIGVVQEQHGERAKLYKQWKRYDFPIAQDPITSLGLGVVPVPILLDENGFVQDAKPKLSNIESLVAMKVAPITDRLAGAPTLVAEQVDVSWLEDHRSGLDPIAADVAIGDRYLLDGTIESAKKAIKKYQSGIEQLKQKDADREKLLGAVRFRLGVAYRTLYDLTDPVDQDPDWFSMAATNWTKALDSNPNQYIWRRRIQQYGPRQIKPYPFYDWVDQAMKEIRERGEVPVQLKVALTEAEIAQPNRKFESAGVAEAPANPDPEGKINLDQDGMIDFHATVVPQRVRAGKAVRVHVRFAPVSGHWNNEAEPLVVWIDPTDAGNLSRSNLVAPAGEGSTSDEVRELEFEFQTSATAGGQVLLKGFALFYVCKTEDGQCLYLRKELEIPIQVDGD